MEDIFETKDSPEFGRYLVVNKTFKAGSTVFEESPIVVSPGSGSLICLTSSNFVCVGCCKVILTGDHQAEHSVRCEQCSWYACSWECAKDPWHRKFECSVFQEYGIEPSVRVLKHLYIFRTVMYINKSSSNASEVLNLASAVEVENPNLSLVFEKTTKDAFTLISTQCSVSVDESLIKTVIKIFFVNSFGLRDASGNMYRGKALFAKSCIIPHSCSPNLDWNFIGTKSDAGHKWTMIMRARHDITPGLVLSIPYTEDFMIYGTVERRNLLAQSYNFLCRCERCTDRSELGTNFSGIMCHCSGVLLPEQPVDPNTMWKCTNDTCTNSVSYDVVQDLEAKFDVDVKKTLEEKEKKRLCRQMNHLLTVCHSKYSLHPNNVKVALATMEWLSRLDLDIFLKKGSDINKSYELLYSRAKQCITIWSKVGSVFDWINCEGYLSMAIIKYRFKSKSGMSVENKGHSLKDRLAYLNEIIEHFEVGRRLMTAYVRGDEPLTRMFRTIKEGYDFWRMELYNTNVEAEIPDDYLEQSLKKMNV